MVLCAAAGAHQDRVGTVIEVARVDLDGFRLGRGEDSPAGHEAGGDGQVDVGGAKIGLGLVGVEVLQQLAIQIQVDRIGPVDEVL